MYGNDQQYLILFLSDVFIPFVKLEISRDIDAAKELLISKGFSGYVTVPVVEALLRERLSAGSREP